jgi:glycosyltransferase involved in cell wall biosynthesis
MKYLHWIRSLAGGAGVMAVEIASRIRSFGIANYVVEMDANYSKEWGTEKRSEELRMTCGEWLINCPNKDDLNGLIIRLNVDVIFYHVWHPDDSTRWTLDKSKIHIAWVHSSNFLALDNYDKYFFVSFSQINALIDNHEYDKFRVIKNGIDIERINHIRSKRRSNKFRICRASGLTVDKIGIDFLYLLKEMRNVEYEFLVIGNGDGKEVLNEYLINNKIFNVRLLGDMNFAGVISYYKSSDLVIYLTGSHVENHSVSLLEAQACGKPIICENKGGLPEQILQRKTGIICNSITEMIENVKMLMLNTCLLRELSFNSKKYSKLFHIQFTVNEVQNILQMIKK